MPTRPMSWRSDPTTISSTVSAVELHLLGDGAGVLHRDVGVPPEERVVHLQQADQDVDRVDQAFLEPLVRSAAGMRGPPAGPRTPRGGVRAISRWSRMKSDVPNRRTSSELRIVVKEDRTTTRVFGETRARRRLNSTPEKSGRNRSTRAVVEGARSRRSSAPPRRIPPGRRGTPPRRGDSPACPGPPGRC